MPQNFKFANSLFEIICFVYDESPKLILVIKKNILLNLSIYKHFYRIRCINRKDPVVFTFSFKFVAFASTAGGLRNWNAAAFASFICFAFFEYRQAGTEPKEAAYAVTDFNPNQNS